MKKFSALMMSIVALFLAECSPSISGLSPTQTNLPTLTSTATFTLTPTITPTWTPTGTPTLSPTPTVVPTPIPGTMYYGWLKDVNGLGVYAGNVALCFYDYICRGETGDVFALGKWDPNNSRSQFVYIGQAGVEAGQISDVTFLFPSDATYKDVVIIFHRLAVDYIAGILPDGREVPFNYTFNSSGILTPGSNFMETWTPGGDLAPIARQSPTLEKLVACGIAGIRPDDNYSMAAGGILFRLPKVSYEKLERDPRLWGTRGMDVYQLIGIRIIYRSPVGLLVSSFCGKHW